MIPATRSVPIALRIPGAVSALVLHREGGAEISESLERKAWNSFNKEQSLSFDSCQRKRTLTFENLLLERKTWLDSSQISAQYCVLGKGTQSQSPCALPLLHLLHRPITVCSFLILIWCFVLPVIFLKDILGTFTNNLFLIVNKLQSLSWELF